MANRLKKINPKKLDLEIAEADNQYMHSASPNIKQSKVGDYVYIRLPAFSRTLKMYRQDQRNKGLLTDEQYYKGAVYLNDGTMIFPDITYDVILTPEIKEMIKRGIVTGGGRTRRKVINNDCNNR